MEFFPNTRVFLRIGNFDIMWYAVLIILGVYIAYVLSARNIKKMGYKVDMIDNLLVGLLISGFIGARLWYVLFYNLSGYLKDPLSIFMIREGGLAIQGGLIFGTIYGFYYARKHKLDFMMWADAIVPNILIAQGVGRWGNFMNQEAYGGPVSESFYNGILLPIKNMMLIDGAYRLPTFLFESVGDLLGWVLIIIGIKKFAQYKKGDLTFAYLMWYGTIRFFIEGFRTDSLMFGSFRVAQIISLIFILVGLLGYLGVLKNVVNKLNFALDKNNNEPLIKDKPVLLFDFDGTLMDTKQCIQESFKHVFSVKKPEYKLSEEELLSFVGPTLWESFGRYFDEDEVDECVAMYREYNQSHHKEYVKPMPDAETMLETLSAKGYSIGIVSSKLKEVILLGMEDTTMTEYIEVIVGAGDVDRHKPDPQGIYKALELMNVHDKQVIYIGDTPSDVKAGKNANAITIAYISSPGHLEAIKAENPDYIIYNLLEILTILKED